MRRNFWIQVQNYMRKAKFRRKVRNILAMLAVVTVFTTTYALILPAITLENSVPLAGFDANEGKTPEELAAEAERQAAAGAAAAEGSGNGGVDADPAAFVGTGEGGQNPTGDGETPPPTPPDSVEVSGEVSGEFSSDKTDYPSIEGFTMNAEGRVFDASGNEIDPTKLNEAQRQSLLAALQQRTAEEALASYHMNGAGQVLDANEQPVDSSGLSPETLKALEQKYIDEVLSLYHMDKDGTILDSLNQPQDPATFSAAALVALREKSANDAAMSAGEDSEKEPGSHDLSLYKMLDNGHIVSEDGAEIPAERFSEEELASLKKAWSERVLAEYTIDENGEVKNAQGETIDSSAFPEELLLALRQKAADSSEALPYALKMYMDQDLVIKDGFTHEPVSEEKLNELSAQLRDILYGFEVNYDARLEVKDRYTAGLRAQGLDVQAESVASSAAPMAEAGRQQTLADNARQIAAGEAALDAEVQAELAQVKEQAASAERGQGNSLPIDLNSLNSQADAANLARSAQDGQDSLNSLDSEPIALEDLAGQQALAADQNGQQTLGSAQGDQQALGSAQQPMQAPQPMGAGQPMRAPIPPQPPTGLDQTHNTVTQDPPKAYYYYTDSSTPNNSSFVRIRVVPFQGQNIPGLSYVYPTGQLTQINWTLSNADKAFEAGKTVRLYFKADNVNTSDPKYTPPGKLTIPGPSGDIEINPNYVDDPDGTGRLYYYDITGMKEGGTAIGTTYFNYPNGTLGGNTTIWAENLGTTPPSTPDYAITNPPDNADYINIPHVTEPRQQQVAKSSLRSPSFNTLADKNSYVTGLSFSVQDTVTGSREYYDNFGELNYQHTENYPDIAVDTLTLPEGLDWRESTELATALGTAEKKVLISQADIPAEVKGVPASLRYPGTLLTVTLNGQKYAVAYVEESRRSELYYDYTLALEGGKLVLTAKAWYQAPHPADKIPLWNNSTPLRYQIGEELIKFKAAPTENDAPKNIKNDVDYKLHLQDGTPQNSHADVTVVLKPKTAHLSIKKKAENPAPDYFGEQAGWSISVKNDSTYAYNKLETLKDTLSPNLYLSYDDLYKLFTAAPAFEGQGSPTVTIQNATLVTTPDGNVPNASGSGTLPQDAQHHGVNTPYNGLAKTDPDTNIKTGVTLTITKEGENVVIEAKDASGVISTKSLPLSYLQNKTNIGHFNFDTPSLSYIVTNEASYEISWPYQKNGSNFTFQGGDEHTYNVPTTVKDSFMLLREDRLNAYPSTNIGVTNDADGTFNGASNEDHSIDNREARHPNARREADIKKSMNDAVKGSGFGSFLIEARHNGKGVPEVLTITDHITKNFVKLLVLRDDNHGKNFTTTKMATNGDIYGQVEADGDYYFRTADDQKVLGHVRTLDDGTKLIQWHFDKATVGSAFDKKIRVVTYFDPSGTGTSASYANETWMNDHATHRLYDSTQKSPINDFNKKIVTKRGGSPGSDELTDFSRIQKGDKVIYRLEITANAKTVLTRDNLYDLLPETPGTFTWSTSNVKIIATKSTNNNFAVTFHQDFNTAIQISTNKPDGHHQKLTWTADGPLMTFNDIYGTLTAYIYLELSFPSDDAMWNQFVSAYQATGIDNIFHVYEGEKSVHHSLGSTQLVHLGKQAVYTNLMQCNNSGWNNNEAKHPTNYYSELPTYWNSPSTFQGNDYYNKWLDKKGVVLYNVSLCNPSSEKMYLSELTDTLPRGFHFAGLAAYNHAQNLKFAENPINYAPSGYLEIKAFSDVFYQGKKLFSGQGTWPIRAFRVRWNEDNTKSVFTITDIKDSNGTSFKDTTGWYLPPKSALSFAYLVIADEYAKTDDLAENRMTMAYTEPFPGAMPELPAEGDVTVDSGPIGDRRNVLYGKEELKTDENNHYILSSSVTLQREPTQIGISKRYTGTIDANGSGKPYPDGTKSDVGQDGTYQPAEQLTWQVDLTHQSGVVQNWSFTETMEKPYGFDEIKFYPQGYEKTNDLIPGETWANDICYTFTFKEKTDGSYQVTLERPPLKEIEGDAATWDIYKSKSGTLSMGGSLNLGDNMPGGATPNFRLELTRDAKNNQQLTITPEAGYFGYTYALAELNTGVGETKPPIALQKFPKFLIKTSNHSISPAPAKLYHNTARLTPTVPIVPKAAGGGHYENSPAPSVVDGANAPVFGSKATVSNKSVCELDPKNYEPKYYNTQMNSATGNPLDYTSTTSPAEPTSITLPDEQTPVRYTLRVKNLSSEPTAAIDNLVLADNLPQSGDTGSWNIGVPRNSEFQVNLAKNPNFKVVIQNYNSDGTPNGQPIELGQGTDYLIEYSVNTQLGREPDYLNEDDPEWSDKPSPKTRSFRLRTRGTDAAKISVHAVLELTYDAVIDSTFVPSKEDQIAWNSFGYRYHMVGSDENDFAESEPAEVGIKVPGVKIPVLKKQRLFGQNGYPVDSSEAMVGGTPHEKISYLFLILNSNKNYVRNGTSKTAKNFLEDNLRGSDPVFANLKSLDLKELQRRLSDALDGRAGTGSNRVPDTYQLYQVPVSVGQSKGWIPLTPEKDANDPTKTVGITIKNYGAYVVLELVNPANGKPYIVKEDGKIYEDDVTSLQGFTIENNTTGSFTPGALSQDAWPYPNGLWSLPYYGDISQILLTGTNEGKRWNINLLKTDGTSTSTGTEPSAVTTPNPLLGAVFGLYSPQDGDALSQAEIDYLQRQYKFTEHLSGSYTDAATGKTYYLKEVSDGKALGAAQPFDPTGKIIRGDNEGWSSASKVNLQTTARFVNLTANEYILRELKAPEGYKASTAPILLKRSTYYADKDVMLPSGTGTTVKDNVDAWALVSNEAEAVEAMPETGGIGRWPFILGGLFFLLVAGAGLLARRRQAALEAAPQSRR